MVYDVALLQYSYLLCYCLFDLLLVVSLWFSSVLLIQFRKLFTLCEGQKNFVSGNMRIFFMVGRLFFSNLRAFYSESMIL